MQIDNIDIAVFGLQLTKVTGEFDMPKLKRPYSHTWNDAHGIDIDLSKSYIEPRELELSFIVTATSATDFAAKLPYLQKFLQYAGLRVLKFDDIARPYFAYLTDEVNIGRLTGYRTTTMWAKFTAKFTEQLPVGRYFASANLLAGVIPNHAINYAATTDQAYNILWSSGLTEYLTGTSNTSNQGPNLTFDLNNGSNGGLTMSSITLTAGTPTTTTRCQNTMLTSNFSFVPNRRLTVSTWLVLNMKYVSGTYSSQIVVTYDGGKTKTIAAPIAQPSTGVWTIVTYNLGQHIELAAARKIENIEIKIGTTSTIYELNYVQLTNDKYYATLAGDVENLSSVSLTNLTEI